ncbi:hypothetical protein SAY87_001378 [Trapa incisa]|uniref:Uncharacterized protein n=1 Tax=Trapa incisa TaxID=236973 RepID=A0AAN7JHC1_9MYRT|nr:hypothetical protein SAY87_001378 [Trapa incisa]
MGQVNAFPTSLTEISFGHVAEDSSISWVTFCRLPSLSTLRVTHPSFIIFYSKQEVWTICRVFKRTPRPTLSKCVDPKKKGKKHDAAKQTLVSTAKDSTSKSCSFDSCYGEHWVSLGDCVMAQQSDNHGSAKYLDWEPYSSFWEVGEMQII